MKKDEFKEFVKKNPGLINYVKNNEMTWQKFYEIYDLYGEDENAWKNYIKKEETSNDNKSVNTSVGALSITDFINWFKNIDLDGLQQGIGNVQRVLGLVGELSNKNTSGEQKSTYKPRPLYKHFED